MDSRVIFGLGNPGLRYSSTRHNAGWQALDLLAEQEGASFKRTRLLHGDVTDVRVEGLRVRLVKPSSFMNLTGPVYRRALEVYEVEPLEALVVVDDFALPFGRLRFRPEGSPGGHKGLQSIEQALGGRVYPRLRLGIGPVPEAQDPADYVLRRYDAAQRRLLPDLLEGAASAVRTWLGQGMETAMNRHNPAAPD